MTGDAIREVERDPKEGVIVTVERSAEGVDIPSPCALCLGKATTRLPSAGVNWLEFPYCDECAPRKRDGDRPSHGRLWSFVFGRLGALGAMMRQDLGGPRGKAVKLLLGPSDTTRLAFENDEYARLFVEANGAELPPE